MRSLGSKVISEISESFSEITEINMKYWSINSYIFKMLCKYSIVSTIVCEEEISSRREECKMTGRRKYKAWFKVVVLLKNFRFFGFSRLSLEWHLTTLLYTKTKSISKLKLSGLNVTLALNTWWTTTTTCYQSKWGLTLVRK